MMNKRDCDVEPAVVVVTDSVDTDERFAPVALKLPLASRDINVEITLFGVAFDVIVGLPATPSAFVIDRPTPETAIDRDAAVVAEVRVIRPFADNPAIAVSSESSGCASVMP